MEEHNTLRWQKGKKKKNFSQEYSIWQSFIPIWWKDWKFYTQAKAKSTTKPVIKDMLKELLQLEKAENRNIKS